MVKEPSNSIANRLDLVESAVGHMLPPPQAGAVVMYVNFRGEVRNARSLWTRRVMRIRAKTFYEVRTGEESLDFSCELPCKNDIGHFIAQVHLAWKVSNPEEILNRNLQDAPGELEPLVRAWLRELANDFSANQRDEAEKTLNLEVGRSPVNLLMGIETCRFNIELELDETAARHVQELDEIDHNIQVEEKSYALEQLRIQHQQTLLQDKMGFWRPIVEGGSREALISRLAGNTNDIPVVADILIGLEDAERDRYLQAFDAMLEANVIEGFDLEEPRKVVLKRLIDELRMTRFAGLTGNDGTRAPALEGPRTGREGPEDGPKEPPKQGPSENPAA